MPGALQQQQRQRAACRPSTRQTCRMAAAAGVARRPPLSSRASFACTASSSSSWHLCSSSSTSTTTTRAAPVRARRCTVAVAASATAAAPLTAPPKLSSIELLPLVDTQGTVHPAVPADTQATVFAVYDANQKLQYVGFSRDLRNSLRTLLGRRPDKAFFYKAAHLPAFEQDAMIALRDAWFDECGGAPAGNRLQLERAAWQQAVDAGAISARGKRAAAEEKAKELLAAVRARGCREGFEPDPALLADGKVDFLPAEALSADQVAERAAALAAAVRTTREAKAIVDGQVKSFRLEVARKYPTNGGCLLDVVATFDNMESKHRIIVGAHFYEPYGVEPETVVEAALALLLSKKLPRRTEGMLTSGQFPVNYFSVSEVQQWFGDDFGGVFEAATGRVFGEGAGATESGAFWRFNKVEDYGPMKLETAEQLNASVGKGVGVANGGAAGMLM